MRKTKQWVAAVLVSAAAFTPAPAFAGEAEPVPSGLTPDQLATIAQLQDPAPASSVAVAKPGKGSASAAATRRASYYQGSALMWTRDNVDFGFDWSRVNWSSGFQQNGWIWPNISRNDGISRYVAATRYHTWRGGNSFGAGVPTPWGDVKVYNLTYSTRVNVEHNGAWQAQRS